MSAFLKLLKKTTSIVTAPVNVAPVNAAPVSGNDTLDLLEDSAFAFTSSSFVFSDADGDALQAIRFTSLPNNGLLKFDGNAVSLNQTIAATALATLRFVPVANYNGEVKAGYQVQDSKGAWSSNSGTLTLVVAPANDAPVASALVLSTYEDDGPITVTAAQLLAMTSDTDSKTLSVTSLQLNEDDAAKGQLSHDGQGNWAFSPAANFYGDVGLTYTVTDGSASVSSIVQITINNDFADLGDPHLVEAARPAGQGQNQRSVLTLVSGGALEQGDEYQISVVHDGQTYSASYVVTEAGDMLVAIVENLHIQLLGQMHGIPISVAAEGDKLILEGASPTDLFEIVATGFNASAGAGDGEMLETVTPAKLYKAPVMQQKVLELSAEGLEPGDTYRFTLNDEEYVEVARTGESLEDLAYRLLEKLKGDETISADLSVVSDSVVTLTVTALQAGPNQFELVLPDGENGSSIAGINAMVGTEDGSVSVTTIEAVEQTAAAPCRAVLDFGEQSYQYGESITFTLGQTSVSYLVKPDDDSAAIARGLADLIEAKAITGVTPLVGSDGRLTVELEGESAELAVNVGVANLSFTENTAPTVDSLIEAGPGQGQIVSLFLGDEPYDVGDKVTLNVAGKAYTYIVKAENGVNDIAAELVNLYRTASDKPSGIAASYSAATAVMRLVGDVAAADFAAGLSVADVAYTANQDATVQTTAALAATAAARQVTAFTFTAGAGGINGDTFNVTLNDVQVSYTATSQYTSITSVINALVSRVNNDATLKDVVFAQRSGSTLLVTAKADNAAFSASVASLGGTANAVTVVEASAGADAREQTSTFSLGSEAYDAGDLVWVSISGKLTEVSVEPGDTVADVAARLASALSHADNGVTAAVNSIGQLEISGAAGASFGVRVEVVNAAPVQNELEVGRTLEAEYKPAVRAIRLLALDDASYDIGDVITIKIDDIIITHEVTGTETSSLVQVLAEKIDQQAAAKVTAEVVEGKIKLTATEVDVPLSVSAELAETGFVSNQPTEGVKYLNVTSDNVVAVAAVAQVTLVVLKADETAEAGDLYVLNFITLSNNEEITVEYRVPTAQSANELAESLAAAVAVSGAAGFLSVQAENNVLRLTATEAGKAFTVAAQGQNGLAGEYIDNGLTTVQEQSATGEEAQAEISTLDLTDYGLFDQGDTVTLNLNGVALDYVVSQNGTTGAAVATELARLVNDDAGNQDGSSRFSELATAEASVGVINLTSVRIPDDAIVAGLRYKAFTAELEVADRVFSMGDAQLSVTPDEVASEAGKAVQKQVTRLVLKGTFDAGDSVSVFLGVETGLNPFEFDPQESAGESFVSNVDSQGVSAASVISDLCNQINTAFSDGSVFARNIVNTLEDGSQEYLLEIESSAALTVQSYVADASYDEGFALTRNGLESLPGVKVQPQVRVLEFGGDIFDQNDSVTLGLPNDPVTYTPDRLMTRAELLEALVKLVNEEASNPGVTASIVGTDGVQRLALTAVANVGFSPVDSDISNAEAQVPLTVASAAGQNAKVNQQQETLIELAGTYDQGDKVTVEIDGSGYTYTISRQGMAAADVAAALQGELSGNSGVSAQVVEGGLLLTSIGYSAVVVQATVSDAVFAPGTNAVQSGSAGQVAQQQVNRFTLSGEHFDFDELLILTLGSGGTAQIIEYRVTEQGQSLQSVLGGLKAVINAQASGATASIDGTQLVLTVAGNDPLPVALTLTEANLTANASPAVNQTQVASLAAPAVSQISTVHFVDNDPQAGDAYSVEVDGRTISYTTPYDSITLTTALNALVTRLNNDPVVSKIVGAVRSGDLLILTGKTPGQSFALAGGSLDVSENDYGATLTTPTQAVLGSNNAVQVSVASFGNQGFDAGDKLTLKVGAVSHSVTLAAPASASAALAYLITAFGSTAGFSLSDQGEGRLELRGTSFGKSISVSATLENAVATDNEVTIGQTTAAQHAAAQQSVLTLSGATDPGDAYTLNVGGREIAKLVIGDSYADLNDLAIALAAAANADSILAGAGISAAYDSVNKALTLTGNTDGTAFEALISGSDYQAQGNADAAAASEQQAAQAEQKQISRFDFSGGVDDGDSVSLVVDGQLFTVTAGFDTYVQSNDSTAIVSGLPSFAAAMAAKINSAGGLAVTASASDYHLDITAKEAGKAFQVAAGGEGLGVTQHVFTNNTVVEVLVAGVTQEAVVDTLAQIEVFDFATEDADAGDVLTLTLNNTDYSVTAGELVEVDNQLVSPRTNSEVAKELVAKINTGQSDVTAAYDPYTNQLKLLGKSDGTPFSASVNVTQFESSQTNAPDIQQEGVALTAAVTQHAIAVAVPQKTVFLFAGLVDPGDSITVVVEGIEFTAVYGEKFGATEMQVDSTYELAQQLFYKINQATDSAQAGDPLYGIGATMEGFLAGALTGSLVISGRADGLPFTASIKDGGLIVYQSTNNTTEQAMLANETQAVIANDTLARQVVAFDGVNTLEPGDHYTVSATLGQGEAVETFTASFSLQGDEGQGADALAMLLYLLGDELTVRSGGRLDAEVADGHLVLTANDPTAVLQVVGHGYNRAAGELENSEPLSSDETVNVVQRDALAKVVTLSFGAQLFDIGDEVVLNLAGTPYSYRVTSEYARSGRAVLENLLGVLSEALELPASITYDDNGTATFTANEAGTDFSITLTVNDEQMLDNVVTLQVLAAAAAVDAGSQVTQVSIVAGTLDAGDVYRLQVGEQTLEYVVTGDEQEDLATIISIAFSEQLAGTGLSAAVVDDASGALLLEITGEPGLAFEVGIGEVINRPAGSADNALSISWSVAGQSEQLDEMQATILSFNGTAEVGETWSFTVDLDVKSVGGEHTVEYTLKQGDGFNELAFALADQLASQVGTGLMVKAIEGEAPAISLSGMSVGQAFAVTEWAVGNRAAGSYGNGITIVEMPALEAGDAQGQVSSLSFLDGYQAGQQLFVEIDTDGQPGYEHSLTVSGGDLTAVAAALHGELQGWMVSAVEGSLVFEGPDNAPYELVASLQPLHDGSVI